jgi:excisionase family DNA binding protein
VNVVTIEEFEALAARVAELEARLAEATTARDTGTYMTVQEAAGYLRCSRQRIDDLLSQRRLTRFKDGSRILVSRSELRDYVARR